MKGKNNFPVFERGAQLTFPGGVKGLKTGN
jgi:hypothetical protein